MVPHPEDLLAAGGRLFSGRFRGAAECLQLAAKGQSARFVELALPTLSVRTTVSKADTLLRRNRHLGGEWDAPNAPLGGAPPKAVQRRSPSSTHPRE